MKSIAAITGLLLLVATVCFADAYPTRKPGLWQLVTSVEGVPDQSAKQCIDAATDALMMKAGTQMQASMGVTCAKNESRQEDAKFLIETDCTMSGIQMTSKTTMEGDFNAAYTSTTETKYNPPFYGKSDGKMVIRAKYLGACEAGQTPGDIILSNGMKMNMNAMAEKH